jgi:hypothetical protein
MLVLENDALQLTIWDRTSGKFTVAKTAPGTYVAENSEVRWSEDGKRVAFAVRSSLWKEKAKARFTELTSAPITALDGTDDFLEWDGIGRLSAERSVVSWDPATNTVTTLVPWSPASQWTLARDGSVVTVQEDITKKTDYDVIGGREYRLVTRTSADAPVRTLAATLKGATLQWADDGKRFALTRDGKVFIGSTADTVLRQLLGAKGDTKPVADTGADARAAREKERFTATRFSTDGTQLLASNRDGLWVVNIATGARDQVAVFPDSTSSQPRPTLAAWSGDGRYVYLYVNSKTKWERAIVKFDRESRQSTEWFRDARRYSGLRLSRDGATAVLSIAEGNRPPDVWVAENGAAPRRVVESNPQLATKPVARTELINYHDADGNTRFGVLHYPTNYERGKRYPTVFIIYEDVFDDTFDAVANLLAAHGYAVVKPSVGFEIGYPGEAWMKGVTAAANAVIAMARRARHELRRLRDQPADHADASLQGGDQHERQGGHGVVLYGQSATRRPQHSRCGKIAGPHRRNALAAAAKIRRALGDLFCRSHYDAVAVAHRR